MSLISERLHLWGRAAIDLIRGGETCNPSPGVPCDLNWFSALSLLTSFSIMKQFSVMFRRHGWRQEFSQQRARRWESGEGGGGALKNGEKWLALPQGRK